MPLCGFCDKETSESVLKELGMCGSCQDFFDDPGSYDNLNKCPLCGNFETTDYLEEYDMCRNCNADTD